jgi:glycosyltransferase involved in cell wall biosynthesis
LLVRPGDTDGMADAMLRLLQDAQMRRTMAAFAAQRATRDFSAAGMAQGYADLYESSLRGGVPAASEPRAEILAHHLNQ